MLREALLLGMSFKEVDRPILFGACKVSYPLVYRGDVLPKSSPAKTCQTCFCSLFRRASSSCSALKPLGKAISMVTRERLQGSGHLCGTSQLPRTRRVTTVSIQHAAVAYIYP